MLSAVLLFVLQSPEVPATLGPSTHAAVMAYASPTARDLTFQSLDWNTSIYEGLIQAQKQDKPLLLWQYFGDPRGHC